MRIEGRLTALSAVYPERLCTVCADAILNQETAYKQLCVDVHRGFSFCGAVEDGDGGVSGVFDDDDEGPIPEEPANETPENPEREGFGDNGDKEGSEVNGVNSEEWKLLHKIHQNLGHPNASSLQKLLRQAGAPSKCVHAAGKLQCDVCIKQAQRKPVLPSTTCAPQVKWDTISVDTFYWQNPCNDKEGNERHLLGISYFDEATDLHVASIVREGNQLQGSLRAEEFKEKFLEDWLRCLPKPKMVRFDTEGCFRSDDLKHWLEENMIQIAPIAGEAYWQVGKHS